MMTWDYLIFNIKDGKLYYEDGCIYLDHSFNTLDQAEQYLIDNDLRATIL